MTSADADRSPLAGDVPDLAPVFELLGDETRLRILRTLAERERTRGSAAPVAFADLRRRVGVRDAGQFNYHLGRLRSVFVEKRDGGYVLTERGREVGALVLDAPRAAESA